MEDRAAHFLRLQLMYRLKTHGSRSETTVLVEKVHRHKRTASDCQDISSYALQAYTRRRAASSIQLVGPLLTCQFAARAAMDKVILLRARTTLSTLASVRPMPRACSVNVSVTWTSLVTISYTSCTLSSPLT